MMRGILFDKDGTLLDLEKTWIPAYRKAAKYLASLANKPELSDRLMMVGGYDPKTGQWTTDSVLASGSNDDVVRTWESELGFKLTLEKQQFIRSQFFLSTVQHIPVSKNLSSILHEIKSYGVVLGLATMDDESSARAMLKEFALHRDFDFICGADSGFGLKPDPGMVEAFCRDCNLCCEEIMVVGDSLKDMKMARTAKTGKVVAVLSGAHNRSQLEPDADIIIQSIEELPKLVESLLLNV
ncbi:MAG: HAD family hydrolase [Gammaproteobacteria bacterium]|nr:HAD family hydrolase [Gammaproteobacteria bacterium]MCY4217913.1 HAD family hydrolase [Gammaproteobacteria bacterium]MCY4275228.1 HAD family hydrolase [Gammaproteobacteria bacterium]